MRARAFLLLIGLACACGGPAGSGDGGIGDDDDDDDDDDDLIVDASIVDAPTSPIDSADPGTDGGCEGWQCEDPVVDGCVADEVCSNGVDDDCNGLADDGCLCVPGAVQPCFVGAPGRRGVGACVDGIQTCFGVVEFGYWGECRGGLMPIPESCDGQDNDCNGCPDDDEECCSAVGLACPGQMDDGAPFANYVIDGAEFFGGAVSAWSWDVTGGPCDQLFAGSGASSFTLTGQTTSTLTFRPTLSGDYTVHVTMETLAGPQECSFIVHIAGPGLRVEACWNTAGQTDLDLHLHRPNTTTPWLGNPNNDDCTYHNCKGSTFSNAVDWGYANSPLAECSGGPEGSSWTQLGYCRNPRLDIDNIAMPGVPENINVDVPENAAYRVAVHYYGGPAGIEAHPLVNVYCGGYLLGSYGAAPDVVPGFDDPGSSLGGSIWRVVDVTPTVVDGLTTGCELTALHPPGETTGYFVTEDDLTY